MSPESRRRVERETRRAMEEMVLCEVRGLVGMTQAELAQELGVSQASVSQMENQDDMQINTLRRIVEALGGQLEIIARLPGGDIAIRPKPRKRGSGAACGGGVKPRTTGDTRR